jgi:hypothetical protein
MAARTKHAKKAIEDSLHFEPEAKSKHKKQEQIGSDTDSELWNFFSGGCVGDLGLRSTMGSALERAAFELGPSSGSIPSGFNDLVRFGVNGPAGRVEAGRIARALGKLMGDCPDPKLKREWPYYFAVLRGYYTQHSTSYYEGLISAFADHAGAALVVPKGKAYIRQWCNEQCIKDKHANAKAIHESQMDHPIDATDWNPDTEVAIRRRWEAPSEEDSLAALRTLVKASNGSKDVPTRQGAKATLQGILDEARTLRWAARSAYVGERRKVDAEIRDRPTKMDEASLARMQAALGPMIDPNED